MASPAILLSLWIVGVIFSSTVTVTVGTSSKVELALYYETLCPYCSNFMVNYLPTIFKNKLVDIIDLKLVPYGNAKIGANNTITCQHGPYECLLNTVEGCLLHVYPDLKKDYTFIYCVERLVFDGKYLEWESCFGKTGFDSKPIEQCYKSGLGKELDLQYAKETSCLDPPHTYVPWVTVNGKPLYEDYKNFTSYVCNAYKGNPVPKACKGESTLQISNGNGGNQIKEVCPAEEDGFSSSLKADAIYTRSLGTSPRRQMKMRP